MPWYIIKQRKLHCLNSKLNWAVLSFNVFLCRGADNCRSLGKQLILSAMVWLPLGDRTNRCRFDSRCSAEDLAWVWADLACANPVATPTKSWNRKSHQQWGELKTHGGREPERIITVRTGSSHVVCFPLILMNGVEKIQWIVNKYALTIFIKSIFNYPSLYFVLLHFLL